ncbi:MAG: hypothetical protein KGJ57_06115 [Sphingomonadales bacterium]|nr:hypothetical protein [Sphingomonadales bacterium]MDE2168994.1 hypothetical protein [Sphingomonadales bacterium]
MFIPGPKLTQVFASRWKALMWAGSVLVSVYVFVSHTGQDKPDAQAMSAAQQMLAGSAVSTASNPVSPWAADSAS